jgi:hypothetical protein
MRSYATIVHAFETETQSHWKSLFCVTAVLLSYQQESVSIPHLCMLATNVDLPC